MAYDNFLIFGSEVTRLPLNGVIGQIPRRMKHLNNKRLKTHNLDTSFKVTYLVVGHLYIIHQ